MRCMVTGGAGFIGSHLVEELISTEHEVCVVDDESAESNDDFFWREDADNHKIDICNKDELEEVFKEHKPEVVFHLAAFSRIPLGIKDPVKACSINTLGTCNLLQLSRAYEVGRFIFSSTSSIYGLANESPLREDMPRDCLNPYSVTKAAGEDLCKMYYDLYELPTVIFRYFNVYGERQPLSGQYAPVIGIFQRQKDSGEQMTVVGDGEQRRDFTYVKDVVKANILAAYSENEDIFGEVFNVGNGKNFSVLEIADMIGGEVKHIEERPGEARVTLADYEKIKFNLGWHPEGDLEKWLKENK